jgi:threonine/homoserine/homoserine lactone efflux protein
VILEIPNMGALLFELGRVCLSEHHYLITNWRITMNLELWLAFVAASSLLLIIPGPTILTVMSYSLAHGRSAVIPLIAAVALGDSTALLLSLMGLGALLATSAVWFTAIKWIGGLYLLYMGISLLRAGTSSVELTTPPVLESKWRLFTNTWLVTALNPKGIIIFVSFLPQFINTAVPVTPQLWVLSITFVALATLNASAYALFAGNASRMLSSSKARKRFNVAGGSLLSAAGLWALTAKPTS